jgi:hypothetical protein
MARQRDDEEEDNEDQLKEEAREELIKNLKATRQMFFAYVPKGSLGQLVVCLSKSERDQAAKDAKRAIGGGTPVMGTCVGAIGDKVFKLDKKPADAEKLGLAIKKVVKLSTKLNVVPDIQLKSGPIEEEEED